MVVRRVFKFSVGRFVPALATALALWTVTPGVAEARGRHAFHRHSFSRHVAHSARAALGSVAPNFSAIVVDANTGHTLYGLNEDAPRHPASITKVMTLYLLFEQLDRGRVTLDSPLQVSAHAASQSPTKLGVPAGSTVSVDTAIKAIVTRSANDMAVTVAENLAGDEVTFARLMTEKAHALGMRHTFYHNASGLPDMRQITTARDLTTLGRAIHDRFPRYYRFFSTPSFVYRGQVITSHNHLMARMSGMDGIKTGYTNASGFNLLSSIQRGNRHVVAVVMGGKSAAGRDNIMESLLESHFEEASAGPGAAVAEASPIEAPAAPPRRAAPEPSPIERDPPQSHAAIEQARADAGDDGEDDPVERRIPRGPSLIAPEMALPPTDRPVERVRLARSEFPKAAPLPPSLDDKARGVSAERGKPAAAPAGLRWVVGPQPVRLGSGALDVKPPVRPKTISFAAASDDRTDSIPDPAAAGSPEPAGDEARPIKGGWVIQIGATDTADAAEALLSRARTEGHGVLAAAKPFTEKVQKGDAVLFRARFAGLDPDEADAACKALKRSGFECFATR